MNAINPADLQRLTAVRNVLLHLHKALLDGQRAKYEREHGTIASPGAFLQLAISDPAFDWLHRFSELLVEIDESTEADEPLTVEAGAALLEQARQLTTGDAYKEAITAGGLAAQLGGELEARLTGQDS